MKTILDPCCGGRMMWFDLQVLRGATWYPQPQSRPRSAVTGRFR